MHWNYRIVIDTETSPTVATVCEVYYDGDGKPFGFSRASVIFDSEVDGDMKFAVRSITEQLENMMEDTLKPILTHPQDFTGTVPSSD